MPSQLQISPLARIHPMEKYLLSWTAVLPSTSYNVALSSPMLKKLTSQSPASPETLLGPHTAETFCDDTEFVTLGDRDRGVTVLPVERDFHRK